MCVLLLAAVQMGFGQVPGIPVQGPKLSATSVLTNESQISSIVNCFSFRKSGYVAPGECISIFGVGFNVSTYVNPGGNLPNSLGGSTVNVKMSGNGITYQCPLYYVSPGQINCQLPFGVNIYDGSTATFTVTFGSYTPIPYNLSVTYQQTGLYGSATGNTYAYDPTGQVGTSSSPWRTVSYPYLTVYAVGAGPVSPPVNAGMVTPTSPLSYCENTVTATINGQPMKVLCVLAPDSVGEYQMNLILERAIASGTYTIEVTVASIPLPTFTVVTVAN